jgi:hypothetical protein
MRIFHVGRSISAKAARKGKCQQSGESRGKMEEKKEENQGSSVIVHKNYGLLYQTVDLLRLSRRREVLAV